MVVGAVMPTWNQARFIADAVASAWPQVDELCIVNDGSTDGTAAWLEEFSQANDARDNLQIVTLPENGGTADAINAGWSCLTGKADWITWVSSDNVMAPDWIEKLTAEIAPDVGVVYGGFEWKRPGGIGRYHFTPYDPDHLIDDLNCFFGPAFIIRADVWQAHRGAISHDWDNWSRVEEECWRRDLRIVGVDAELCAYSAHDQRVTVTRRHEFDADKWQAEARKRRA